MESTSSHTTKGNMDSDLALTRIAAKVRHTFDFETVCVRLMEGNQTTRMAYAGEIIEAGPHRPSVFPLGRYLTSRILKEDQPIVIRNFLRESKMRDEYRRFLSARGYRGLIGSSLRPVDRPIGMMTCYTKRKLVLRPAELFLLTNFVMQASLLLETTRLSGEIRTKREELEELERRTTTETKIMDSTLNAVSSLLYEMRDGLHVLMGQNELLLAKPGGGAGAASRSDLQSMQSYLERLRDRVSDIPRICRAVKDACIAEERSRFARELHDGLSQEAGLILVGLANVEAKIRKDAALRDQLTILRRTANSVYEQIRLPIFGLRGICAPDDNIGDSLENYLIEFAKQTQISVRFKIEKGWVNRVSKSSALELMQIVHEALNNVRKHARSRHAFLTLTIRGQKIRLSIRDDGRGFDAARNEEPVLFRFGLTTMRERAESVGGTLEIKSKRGRGTEVIVRTPLNKR